MARRMFYVDQVSGSTAILEGETAQHLRKVLRAEAGQRYEISDNVQLYLAELTGFGKDRAEFRLVETLPVAQAPVSLHLLASIVKFDRFEWILEKATELGVGRITPVYAMRTEKGLDQASRKRMERWRRVLAESGQQARRVVRPVLDDVIGLAEALAVSAGLRWFLDESRDAPPMLQAAPLTRSPADTIALLTGPEGGWDPRERESALAAGWTAVSLGPQILRAETAAIAALAVASAAWDAQAKRTED